MIPSKGCLAHVHPTPCYLCRRARAREAKIIALSSYSLHVEKRDKNDPLLQHSYSDEEAETGARAGQSSTEIDLRNTL